MPGFHLKVIDTERYSQGKTTGINNSIQEFLKEEYWKTQQYLIDAPLPPPR